jgi:hypothetical protein
MYFFSLFLFKKPYHLQTSYPRDNVIYFIILSGFEHTCRAKWSQVFSYLIKMKNKSFWYLDANNAEKLSRTAKLMQSYYYVMVWVLWDTGA